MLSRIFELFLGFVLFLLAIILYFILTIVNLFLVRDSFYFMSTAITVDKYANRDLRKLWNCTLRKKSGYKFGKVNETISSALGKNQRDGTLTFTGKVLAWILDHLDHDHCKKSIQNNI